MSFASDKLYNGYLRRNMPTIVSRVKVREIMIHLPCLTPHDRENIEAKRETNGNFDSMVLLLECLRRRENWPEQFIEALDACEHPTLAAEIRAEYDTIRGTNNFNPSSTPTTVVRAHVHPAPSASHLSIPESGAKDQPAVSLPAEASAPPEAVAEIVPALEIPAQPQAPQISVDHLPEAVCPPEPVPEPPQATQVEEEPRESTPPPPPPPETPHTLATATPPPQREITCHQEPEENSESDIQDISRENGVIPDQASAGNGEVSVDAVATPQASPPVEPCETDTPSCPGPLQTTTSSTEVRPPQTPPPTEIHSDVTDGSSFPMVTPDKPPVQDTSPHVDLQIAAVLQPEQTSECPATQVVETSPQTETAAPTSTLPVAAVMDASFCDDSSMCLSKPGQLISTNQSDHDCPTLSAPSPPVQPYSGNSDRLEISEAAPDTVTSAHPPACSAVSSNTASTVSALPCQENGIALNHNEPEENHYESHCPSFDIQEVMVNVVHVSEEPSILNLAGQSSAPPAQIVNGEAAKEIPSAPPLSTTAVEPASSVNTHFSENCHSSEPALADNSPESKTQESKKKGLSRTPSTNTKYILTAAGVGACALLMAWRFKN